MFKGGFQTAWASTVGGKAQQSSNRFEAANMGTKYPCTG